MNAASLATALGGRKAGAGWTAPCPAHEDSTPSLAIREEDGKVLVRCHAGCAQDRVIAMLRQRGLWAESALPLSSRGRSPERIDRRPDQDEARRSAAALAIWQLAIPGSGTIVETYLAARGLTLPLPSSLRFHRGLRHTSGGIWPAMVALVTDGADGTAIAIHRTFFERDGSGKAPVEPAKMMLGPCRGGVVRLADPGEVLMVGEGLETCIAAMQATGRPAWAALSTSGLRGLDLPDPVRDVIVLADGDKPGEAAARDCALRWKRQGRRVRIARPPQSLDFNDMLMNGVRRIAQDAR